MNTVKNLTSIKFLEINSPINIELFIKRGQERYNIYCSVCHGLTGDGKGIVMKLGDKVVENALLLIHQNF